MASVVASSGFRVGRVILIGALGAIAVAIGNDDLRLAKEGARVEDRLRVFA